MQKLNFSRSALFHMKTRVSLKYFVNGVGLPESLRFVIIRLKNDREDMD